MSSAKMTREALCAAQSALTERAERGLDADRVPHWIDALQALIDRLDTDWGASTHVPPPISTWSARAAGTAGRMLDVTGDGYPWLGPPRTLVNVACPACGTSWSPGPFTCPTCGRAWDAVRDARDGTYEDQHGTAMTPEQDQPQP